MSKDLIVRCRLSPGDFLMLSAAVRDLHLCYPDRFRTALDTATPPVWWNSPYCCDLQEAKKSKWKVFQAHYPLINKCNEVNLHFIWGFIKYFNAQMKLNIRLTDFRPDVHLTDAEKADNVPGLEGKYWLIVSGGKNDFVTKWWDPLAYQQVVNLLQDRIRFVQVGARNHHHPPLNGVINMVGQTDFRGLMRLVYHSEGVLCPITCLMHLAAAFNKPCVIVAGGREPYTWEGYTKENRLINMREGDPNWVPPEDDDFVPHRYLHTIGKLPCCKNKGCWKGKLINPDKKSDECVTQVRKRDIMLPACMSMITPELVVDSILSYYGKGKVLNAGDMAVMKNRPAVVPAPDPKTAERAKVKQNAANLIEKKASNPKAQPEQKGNAIMPPEVLNPPPYKAGELAHLEPPVTIMPLIYGDFFDLHKRCIKSIVAHTPKDAYRLLIGANAICDRTREWLRTEIAPAKDFELLDHPENVKKYPLMREAIHGGHVKTKWLIWYDDDSFPSDPNWLYHLAADIQRAEPKGAVMFGDYFFINFRPGQKKWVMSRPWYKGVPWLKHRGTSDKIDFIVGGYWAVRTDVFVKHDWPDPEINHNGGDVMTGEMLHQNGFKIKKSRRGVHINADASGRSNAAKRRGYSEPAVGTNKNRLMQQKPGLRRKQAVV